MPPGREVLKMGPPRGPEFGTVNSTCGRRFSDPMSAKKRPPRLTFGDRPAPFPESAQHGQLDTHGRCCMAYPQRQPLCALTAHKCLQVEAADEVIRRLTPPAPFTTRGGQYEGNLCGWFRPVQIADLLDPRCRNAAGVIHISGSAMWTSSSPGLWILSTQTGICPRTRADQYWFD